MSVGNALGLLVVVLDGELLGVELFSSDGVIDDEIDGVDDGDPKIDGALLGKSQTPHDNGHISFTKAPLTKSGHQLSILR